MDDIKPATYLIDKKNTPVEKLSENQKFIKNLSKIISKRKIYMINLVYLSQLLFKILKYRIE